jgi:hypothetical protein
MNTMTQRRMRVVLQDSVSLLYFGPDNQWIPDLDSAVDFLELRRAHEYARQINHPNLCMVMTFDGERKHVVQIFPLEMPA